MPLQILRADITKISCDAIVNAAKHSLLGGGGVDGAIHAAAGAGLLAECRTLGGCATGEAKITGAYNLPAKYVIHTVGPIWQGGSHGEEALLSACYENSLRLALEHGCQSVAFPLISAGTFGYPKAQAFRLAVDILGRFTLAHDMTVYLVVYGSVAYEISQRMFSHIRALIDDRYVDRHRFSRSSQILSRNIGEAMAAQPTAQKMPPMPEAASNAPGAPKAKTASSDLDSLKEILEDLDESFSQMLLRKIDESGMTDAQCYKKANIDRKHFSKIRNDIHYKPKKETVLAFAIALELSLPETNVFLAKAGFALSDASRFDIAVQFFLERGEYNIFRINEALFVLDLPLLGA